MVRIVCPNCQRIHSVMEHIGDFVCNCNEGDVNKANTEEDVLVLGPWEDYTGSETDVRFNLLAGIENKLQGTRAEIEGGNTHDLTSRGNPKSLYRSRDHLEYINLENSK